MGAMNLRSDEAIRDLLAGSGIPALAALAGTGTAPAPPVPLVDGGDPRGTLWALLDTWAQMKEADWTRDEVSALYNAIVGFWIDYPEAAEGWWEAWRGAHPAARLV